MKRVRTGLLCLLLLLALLCAGCTPQKAERGMPPQAVSETAESAPEAADNASPAETPAPEEPEQLEELPQEASFDPDAVTLESVDSSCFSRVGYDAAFEVLVVEFRDSGAVYAYTGVSAETYDALRAADSLGSYYNRQIKGQYDCQRIR